MFNTPTNCLSVDDCICLAAACFNYSWSMRIYFNELYTTTAAAPASEVEAIVRSPTNMAAAKIAAVDFNKMTSLYRRPACGHVRWGRSASQSTASNASAVVVGHKKSREYLI